MNAFELPVEMDLLALVNGSPIHGAWIQVTLPMKSKNPYRLLFGPTSSEGTLTIGRDDVLREVKKVRELFLMDYVDPRVAWTGVLEVHALNRTEIANVLEAYDTFGSTGVYPTDLVVRLAELDGTLAGHEGEELTVCLTTRGGVGARVRTSTRRVE